MSIPQELAMDYNPIPFIEPYKTNMKLILIIALLLTTLPIFAAGRDMPLFLILSGMGVISVVAATILSWRNKKADSRLAKILMGGLYFWLITFAQLTVFALYYQLAY